MGKHVLTVETELLGADYKINQVLCEFLIVLPLVLNQEAVDTMPYDENEICRIAKWAFEIARKRRKQVCSVDCPTAPPTAPSSTESLSFAFCSVSAVKGSPVASIDAPPINNSS